MFIGKTRNKIGCYRGKDCMKNFCKDLKERAKEVINYEKKQMIPLTYEENKSFEKLKVCFNIDKNVKNSFKLYHKVIDHCHHTGNIEERFTIYVI